MEKKIKGGYYLKARCIQNSKIATMPPYVREIWDWFLKEANHKDNKTNGTIIKRGQLLRTFKDIQEGLKWWIGYRKMTYKKWQCENATKLLMKATMITTMKTTRGMLITILNYDTYQNSRNYESNTRTATRTTMPKQTTDTINNNDKNDKNDNTNTTTTMSNLQEEFLKRWNTKMPFKIKGLSDKRKEHLRTRLQEPTFVENFDLIMNKILKSKFLLGEKPSKTHPNFKADFDWVIGNNTNYLKILEGKYSNPLEIFEN